MVEINVAHRWTIIDMKNNAREFNDKLVDQIMAEVIGEGHRRVSETPSHTRETLYDSLRTYCQDFSPALAPVIELFYDSVADLYGFEMTFDTHSGIYHKDSALLFPELPEEISKAMQRLSTDYFAAPVAPILCTLDATEVRSFDRSAEAVEEMMPLYDVMAAVYPSFTEDGEPRFTEDHRFTLRAVIWTLFGPDIVRGLNPKERDYFLSLSV